MNVNQLIHFIVLSETGSFSRAARRLYITQQGLSYSISSLEEELQVQLFRRNSRGVSLTEYGELLKPYVSRIVQEYDFMLGAMRQKMEEDRSELKLALPFGIFSSIPLKLLLSFREKYPDIHLQVSSYFDNEFERRMMEGVSDIAIANINSYMGRPEDREHFEYVHLYSNMLCVTVNRNNPLAAKKSVTIQDLRGMKVAVYDEHCYNDVRIIQTDCQQNHIDDIQLVYYSEQSSLMKFAEEDYGPSVMALSLDHMAKGPQTRDVPFADREKYAYELGILYPKRERQPENAKKFIRHVREFFRDL